MQDVKFQKPPRHLVDWEKLIPIGPSDKMGGEALYFCLADDIDTWYRYTTSRMSWERIKWLDDANKRDDPTVKPTCRTGPPAGVVELDQNND